MGAPTERAPTETRAPPGAITECSRPASLTFPLGRTGMAIPQRQSLIGDTTGGLPRCGRLGGQAGADSPIGEGLPRAPSRDGPRDCRIPAAPYGRAGPYGRQHLMGAYTGSETALRKRSPSQRRCCESKSARQQSRKRAGTIPPSLTGSGWQPSIDAGNARDERTPHTHEIR